MFRKYGPQDLGQTKLSDMSDSEGVAVLTYTARWRIHKGTPGPPFVHPGPVASEVHWRGGCGKPAWCCPSPASQPAPEILPSPEEGSDPASPPLVQSGAQCLPQAPDTCLDLNVT